MGKKLARNVFVDGEFYAEGAEPPKAVADQITNPNAWEAESSSSSRRGARGGDSEKD